MEQFRLVIGNKLSVNLFDKENATKTKDYIEKTFKGLEVIVIGVENNENS